MSEKKNSKILESFNNCHSISKINELLNLQKNDPVISADQLYEKTVEICGLGEVKLSFYDISSNIKKITKIIDQYPGYGYEIVADRLNEDRKNFLKQLIENIGSLNEALILFNDISDFDTCILPDEGNLLILFDKKIGSYCLDKNNIRGILSELSGFLKKDWKESSRVEINKFYSRIFEKFCVVFFIGIKNCEEYSTAVKYLECIYFNLPADFKVTEGMNKIISSEELINKFASLCKKEISDNSEIAARVDKISNLIISIEKQNTKTDYFRDQLKKRAEDIHENTAEDPEPDFEQIGILDDVPAEKTFSDILSYPETDQEYADFLSFCKLRNKETSDLFYIANAVRLLLCDDLDSLPDPVPSDEEAVLWGRSFYKAVYDSHFNDANQFYVVSSFAEGIPAICKKISEFIKCYLEKKKESITKNDFAAICIAYPNAISSPYYIDAEKAIEFTEEKNSVLLTDFINFCLDNDFTQYPIVVHIVNNNADKPGWEAAYAEFGEEDPDDSEDDDRSGINRGIWFVVLIIILLLAAAAYYFFYYLRFNKDNEVDTPSVQSTVSQTSGSVITSTDIIDTTVNTVISETEATTIPTAVTSDVYNASSATSDYAASSSEVHTTAAENTSKTTSKATSTTKSAASTTKATTVTTKTTAHVVNTTSETKQTQSNSTAANTTVTTASGMPTTTDISSGTTEAPVPTSAESTSPNTTADNTLDTTKPAVADTTKSNTAPTVSEQPSESVSE